LGGCDSAPTTPTPLRAATVIRQPAPPVDTVAPLRGVVLSHSRSGLIPVESGELWGWLEQRRSVGVIGPIAISPGGQFEIGIPPDARLWLHMSERHQPCPVAVGALDPPPTVHVVDDPDRLGGHLPDLLIAQGNLVSGIVYDIVDGIRRPVPHATISLDAYGTGIYIASTKAGTDGRYMFCNVLSADTWGVEAWSPVHAVSFEWLSGRRSVDIELRRP
jgi:hypothetical protein